MTDGWWPRWTRRAVPLRRVPRKRKMKTSIIEATAGFEKWLKARLPIVRQDLKLKHASMAQSAFPFFRATFYRWLQLWPHVCDGDAKAPAVLAVGDLHVENFGTWRDAEGRLIWGIN